MNKIQKRRLLKLADHLQNGKLMHRKFDFNQYNYANSDNDYDKRGCGTLGCALGECPAVFPRLWWFGRLRWFGRLPYLRGKLSSDPLCSAMDFFGVNGLEAKMLFFPNLPFFSGERLSPWNKTPLTVKATRIQVARSIQRFVKWKEAGGEM